MIAITSVAAARHESAACPCYSSRDLALAAALFSILTCLFTSRKAPFLAVPIFSELASFPLALDLKTFLSASNGRPCNSTTRLKTYRPELLPAKTTD